MKVQDSGPSDAKIMLVGEAPGESEESEGRPFVGSAGKLLKHMLSHAGINYGDCYVTNIMDVRPPGNKFQYFYADKSCREPSPALEHGWDLLKAKIEAIRPKVVVALGAEPLRAVCNKRKITEWRGTWLKYRDTNVLPTYHPSYILRQYADHPIVELDLAKANRNEPRAFPVVKINPTLSDVLDWIEQAKTGIFGSFDIETLGERIRTIGFASDVASPMAISIPFVKLNSSNMASVSPTGSTLVKIGQTGGTPGSYWSDTDEVIVLDAISSLFQSPVKFYSQNGLSFDEPFLRREFGLFIRNHHFDTMHGFHCLYSSFPKGLDFLCSILTDYPNYWTEHNPSDDAGDQFYNCMDCVVTLEAGIKIEQELKETTA
jgi:DNA polymerase